MRDDFYSFCYFSLNCHVIHVNGIIFHYDCNVVSFIISSHWRWLFCWITNKIELILLSNSYYCFIFIAAIIVIIYLVSYCYYRIIFIALLLLFNCFSIIVVVLLLLYCCYCIIVIVLLLFYYCYCIIVIVLLLL